MLLCMIGVCINPHGFKMFLYPYQNMMDTTMIHNIVEWRSTSLNEPYHYFYFAFLIFVILTFLISSKKIRFIDFLLLGFCTYLGLKSVRFWAFTPIIMNFCVYDYVKERRRDRGTDFAIILLCVFLLGCFAWNVSNFHIEEYHYCLDDGVYEVLEEKKPERLFNMYSFGGELVYHNIPVFIDGRADLYSPYNYEDYLSISKLEKDSIELIEKYDFDYFLVDEEFPIARYLKNSSDYQVIYSKKDVYLYKKIVNEG